MLVAPQQRARNVRQPDVIETRECCELVFEPLPTIAVIELRDERRTALGIQTE